MLARWGIAAVALIALAACEGGDGSEATRPRPSQLPATTPVPTTSEQVPVLGDFSVSSAAPGTELTTVSAESLEVGDGAVVVLAVERPAVPARCVVEARLRLFVEESSGLFSTELAVYPSRVFDALEKEDGEDFGQSGSLLDVRPRGDYAGEASGWTDWDVTEIVKRWVAGHPFPSESLRVPERGPIVLAVRDVDLAEPFGTGVVASSEAGDEAPHVVVTSRDDCVRGRA